MRARRVVIAVLDVVSRKWLSTVVSAEETSSQIEVAFTDALESEQLLETAWSHGSADLRAAMARGDHDTLERLTTSGDIPLLLTISDWGSRPLFAKRKGGGGPQMRSVTTREFMAGVAIAQQFGRPTPQRTRRGLRASAGTSKPSGHTWSRSATPASWSSSWNEYGSSTILFGCTNPWDMSLPMMSTKVVVKESAKHVSRAYNMHDKPASNTVETTERENHEPRSPNAG